MLARSSAVAMLRMGANAAYRLILPSLRRPMRRRQHTQN